MNAAPALPAKARELLERERVPFGEGCQFLGLSRQAGHPKAVRYMARVEKERRRAEMAGRDLEPAVFLPQRDGRTGEFREIPCYRAGHKLMCRAELLVWMVYGVFS